MPVKPIKGVGTRLRHLSGPNLKRLEETIESLPYKVEIRGINVMGNGSWFIHFLLPDFIYEKNSLDDGEDEGKAETTSLKPSEISAFKPKKKTRRK